MKAEAISLSVQRTGDVPRSADPKSKTIERPDRFNSQATAQTKRDKRTTGKKEGVK